MMDNPEQDEGTLPEQRAVEVERKQDDDTVLKKLDEEKIQLITDMREKKETDSHEQLEWMKRRQQREQKEKDKVRELEEMSKTKQVEWRSERAKKTAGQEKILQERKERLKQFREFQRKVLKEETDIPGTGF
ncbi:U2 small nuclear ribonucleoprotein auxiliary factor 35 kDa subunit-related protein 1-like [Callorhinchus milii]|uniref:U2 small nuclear ribonucleoprotein auxiliary factor 35 kDa subunit-related protein 1-like n=1 Tax=Callorhinchus milii TaxID=7868 RepID=UPI0004574F72|nr:U2 small nuclear ribonucleoprotein auxiliary factor 35 kDa subunit-related protein 1-like [Callorhinchus milii]|eukprot:gi/632971797/ref/XP_007902350.1/ PREDICTED: trichohyalin-like [Callorhinchus milii]